MARGPRCAWLQERKIGSAFCEKHLAGEDLIGQPMKVSFLLMEEVEAPRDRMLVKDVYVNLEATNGKVHRALQAWPIAQ